MEAKQVMEGNIAVCEAAIRAGCTFYAGYPITPQSSITEYLSHQMFEKGREFVQAESEVAAINMVAGASAGGARAMTATSGPGFSLMAEGMSFMSGGRLPGVVVDVQRCGAGGGGILASQCDYNYATKTLGHGGLRGFVVGPESVQESADWTYCAFDIADQYRCLAIVMTDGMIGQMMEPVALPPYRELTSLPKKDWIAEGAEGRERRVLKEFNFNNAEMEGWYKERAQVYQLWAEELVEYEEYRMEDAEIAIAAWGSSARISKTAVDELRGEGIPVGLLRAITLHPFPTMRYRALHAEKVQHVLVVEMSDPAQFYYDVEHAVQGKLPLSLFTHSGGIMITPEEVCDAAKRLR